MQGKNNIAIGFLTMGLFMAYGFLLIYLRDFATGKEEWIQSYSTGKHFEVRLAHVHGNLFAFLNVVIGYLLLQFQNMINNAKLISRLALTGILMPLGILAEVYLNFNPIFVLIGAIAMTASVVWLGISFLKIKNYITQLKNNKMADLNETIVSFNNNIKLSEKRKKELRTSRNAVREDIRKYFDENRDKHTVKFKGQGSFSMNTSILPLSGEYDVDDGVYIFGKEEDRPTPSQAHGWILKAVENRTNQNSIDIYIGEPE